MTKAIQDYLPPPHKVIAVQTKRRNGLRQKHAKLEAESRGTKDHSRAVKKSREKWRLRTQAAEAELIELKKYRLRRLRTPNSHHPRGSLVVSCCQHQQKWSAVILASAAIQSEQFDSTGLGDDYGYGGPDRVVGPKGIDGVQD